MSLSRRAPGSPASSTGGPSCTYTIVSIARLGNRGSQKTDHGQDCALSWLWDRCSFYGTEGPPGGWVSPWPCATTSSSSGLSCGASAGLPSASFSPTAAALGPRREVTGKLGIAWEVGGVGGGPTDGGDSQTPRAVFQETRCGTHVWF